MNSEMTPAELDPAQLEVLASLEQKLDGPVVAYRPSSPFARLTDDQLAALQHTEQRLGVQLLAYTR